MNGEDGGVGRSFYVLTRGSLGRFVWYGMALVWLAALAVVLIRHIPFGLVFGPLFLLYGPSGLAFRDAAKGPGQWTGGAPPMPAIGSRGVGTGLLPAPLALLPNDRKNRPP